MKLFVVNLALLCLTTATGLAEVRSANSLLTRARFQAQTEKKAIFVHFEASWCRWCKRLDTFLDRDEIKPVFGKYFVSVKLDVNEKKNKSLENPGADAVLERCGGPAGLPYLAILDAKGALLVNSKLKGENIGYPGDDAGISWFLQMVKQAAPRITDAELDTIKAVLKEMAPK